MEGGVIGSSPLKSIPNFRDVGDTINQATGVKYLKPGVLYRGARPDEASFQDRKRLINDYKIKSVVDLRTKTEHIEQAKKRDARIRRSAAIPQSNDEVTEPLQIPGVTYHEINFNGRNFSRMLISKTSWLELFWLIILMLLRRRLAAAKVLAPYMEEMGLVGISTGSIDYCTTEVREFFTVLANGDNLPVMVHCTQGKDRTGLTVMLVLFLLEVDDSAIEHDYLLSGPELAPEREERIKEIASIGLSERFADVEPGLVGQVSEHISQHYGSVEKYLGSIGVNADMQGKVKRLFLAN